MPPQLPHSSVRSDSLCTLGETMLPPFNSVKLNWKLPSDSGNPPVLTCVRRVCVASSITGCDGFCLPVRTSYIPAWRQTPVAFKKRPGKKTNKHKKKGRRMLSPVKNCGLLLSHSVGPHNPSLSPCEEVMSSGFFGWRRWWGRGGVRGWGGRLSLCAHQHFCTRALERTPPPHFPRLEFWHSQGLRPVDNEPEPIILSQWIERNRARNESHRAN